MKRKLFTLSKILLGLLLTGLTSICIWIDVDVKSNIKIAQEKYPGRAEDALIAYLLDTTNTPQNRTRVAIWTLGQIQSKKAIPVLENLYLDDPEGKTCSGRHDSVLCQYEICKTLKASRAKLKTIHSRLNK